MKNIFLTALLAATVAVNAFASDAKESHSLPVSNFDVAFKKASNYLITQNKDYIKATFVSNNIRMDALYTPQGDLIGTTHDIKPEELPADAKRTIAKKFEGY